MASIQQVMKAMSDKTRRDILSLLRVLSDIAFITC